MSKPIDLSRSDQEHLPGWIAPTAVLIGQVSLGRNTQIHYNSVIRGDDRPVVIGEYSVILENCFLKSSPSHQVQVGRWVRIGHGSVLQGCTVQDGVVIGDGSHVLEGVLIGKGSLVAPGAVVYKDTVLPPYCFYSGQPGQPPRMLRDEEIVEMKALWKCP